MKKYLSRKRRMAQLAIISLLSATACCVCAQADPESQRRARRESGLQQQREQLQQQTDERRRLLDEPDGRLPDVASEIYKDTTLPAEAHCFAVEEIHIDLPEVLSPVQRRMGASVLPQDPFYFLRQAAELYRGRCVGFEGINLIQRRLSALILAQNYSTTRLGIPRQELSSGRLTLVLIPGVIRSISFSDPDVDGNWKTAFPARPGELLNVRKLEQGQEQLKRITSRMVDVRLAPAARPGESDVIIVMRSGKPWRLAVTLDNSGAKGTGQLQAGIHLAIDDPLGLNDLFSLGLNSDANRDGRRRGTSGNYLNYSLPYGNWTFGMTAGSYTYHQQIAGLYQTFVSAGKGQNLEFRITSLFQRDRNQKNSLQFKVGKRWNRAYIDDTELEVQRRNATYAELAWVHRLYPGVAQLDVMLAARRGVSWFRGDVDPAGHRADAPTMQYALQTIDATLAIPFHIARQPLTYTGTFRGQTTRSPLYASEQFSIGNRYTVRGFDGELTLSAERGFFLRNEVQLPLGASMQTLYAGLDAGRVFGPTVPYMPGDKLAGAAVGVRGAMQKFSYDFFLGWPLAKPEHFRTSTPTLAFNLAVQY